MNQLTKVECWICTFSSAVVAASCVFSFPFMDSFVGAALVFYLCLTASIDLTLTVLLLILKNEGDWWGW